MHPHLQAFALKRGRVERHASNGDAYAFFNLPTGPELFDTVEQLLPEHRERLFPPSEALSIFLAQALSAELSCQKAVDENAQARGRRVDGMTVVLADTPANQAQDPQSHSQKPGLGFPLYRLVGMVCLGIGAVLDAGMGPFQGKGGDERSLLHSILHTLECGDLLLGDA